ncbi:Dyp-type peroxidase [Microbacterium flavum]|uniref:Dyp-type peroxidase n=1 Tax=Microbacterium flavum TaxID=415216 RepID=UPI0024AE6759|nr:Dyp-type peroxidase [Microbacterium flavum]
MSDSAARRVPIEPQSVDAPLTSSAVLLTLVLGSAPGAVDTVRGVLGDLDDIVKNVAFRDLHASLACTVGIGGDAWDAVARAPRPRELHPFRAVRGAAHTAPSTPGDLLLHIRADRRDLCFELERQLLDRFGDAVRVVDETVGFRYFDARDLLGFVDGTANPVGPALPAATIIGDEDPAATGGSYLVVQKYVHDLSAWKGLTTEQQEAVIGRTKSDNIELDDAAAPDQKSHKTLSTIVDDAGVEHDILRDNMPFGSPGQAEFGTYFIGYTRELWVIERMLERMFIGDPPGAHDRLLDVSTALTGGVYFVPPSEVLAGLGD